MSVKAMRGSSLADGNRSASVLQTGLVRVWAGQSVSFARGRLVHCAATRPLSNDYNDDYASWAESSSITHFGTALYAACLFAVSYDLFIYIVK